MVRRSIQTGTVASSDTLSLLPSSKRISCMLLANMPPRAHHAAAALDCITAQWHNAPSLLAGTIFVSVSSYR